MQDENTGAAPNDGLTEALASIPSEPAPAVEDRDEPEGGPTRDEQGRFAAKAQAEADTAAKASGDDDPAKHRIPLPDYLSEREKRQAAERRAEEAERRWEAFQRQQQQQRQQPPQRPDLYNDPDAYAEYVEQTVGGRVKTVEEMVRDRFVNMTFDSQAEALGKDVFDPMVNAFIQTAGVGGSVDPQLFRSVVEASNPGAALVRWHKRHQAQTEVGGDIDGYNARLRDKLKKDPEFRKEFMAELEAEARGGSPARSSDNITSLPSLNRAPGGAGRQQLGDLGSSDQEMFSNLTRKRR